MISKPRKKVKTKIKRNPEDVADMFGRLLKEKDAEKKRKLAQTLKYLLSENHANYWNITKQYTAYRDPQIDAVITQARIIKPSKRKNPVKSMFRDTEVVIKHRGNKIVFDEEDADIIKNLIRKQYSDNDEVKEILK